MATIKTPISKLKKSETIEHYNAVLLEEIKSDMKLVIEGMETTKISIHKKMDEFREEVNEHFKMTDFAIGKHSEQLQNIEEQLADHGKQLTDHGKQLTDHGKQLAEIKIDIEEIKVTVNRTDEKFSKKIDNHETRITNLETARL